ncbi:MAG: hypothetical protein IKX59_00545 [Bacteroidales bacterium]|nr:hypothetical protein [Bacteroidales bacterium]
MGINNKAKVLLLLLFYCSIMNCRSNNYASKDDYSHIFSLKSDTLYLDKEKFDLNIDDNIDTACKWRDAYYLMLSGAFLSVSENLMEIHQIEPPEVEPTCFGTELFVRNDSLMISSYDEKDWIQYYNPLYNKWDVIEEKPREPYKRIQLIREDDTYKILFHDMGEFGGRLFFVDKQTGQEYFYRINCERVIQYQNDYYLICLDRIFRIHDPAQNNIELILKEDEYVYDDFTSCYVSAFILSEELYFVANNQEETYVARLNGQKLEYVFGLGQQYNFLNDYNYNLVANQFDDRVLLKFYRYESNPSCGIMDIEGNQIRLLFFCIGKRPDNTSTSYILCVSNFM